MDLRHQAQHFLTFSSMSLRFLGQQREWEYVGGNKGKVGGAAWLTVDSQRQVWSALPVITRRTCNLWLLRRLPAYVTDYRLEAGARWRDDKHSIREGNNRELLGEEVTPDIIWQMGDRVLQLNGLYRGTHPLIDSLTVGLSSNAVIVIQMLEPASSSCLFLNLLNCCPFGSSGPIWLLNIHPFYL